MVEYKKFDIFLITLDPARGSEIKKTRPCLIISPDEMNRPLKTLIIAPLTSNINKRPMRILTALNSKKGSIVLDQIRTVDKSRILKKLGTLDSATSHKVLDVLRQMFS